MSPNGPALDIDNLGKRAETMIEQLGRISSEPDRLTRLYLSPEHRRAADQVAAWMRDAGLAVSEDALGTVRGRLEGASGKRLLIGSHIDTVIGAGKYDGIFGVVAGVLAAGHVARGGEKPPFGIDVLAFGDEEGSRFSTTLSSSAAVAGNFRMDSLSQVGRDGVTLADALAAYGKNINDIPAAAYKRGEVAGYMEVHIEQGPVLEARSQPLGVVTAIVGQTYLNVEIRGEAGHAGTVPMDLRRDALAGAAEIVGVAERFALAQKDMLVATVGRLSVEPNATNVIPAKVTFTLDLRAAGDGVRSDFAEWFRGEAAAICTRRKLTLSISQPRNTTTTPCDPHLQDLLAQSIEATGGEALRLPSGAGHDGQSMAKLCPIGMLFVRCKGGVSHNPAEYTRPHDMGIAVAALIDFIGRFDVQAST
jgi:allantoate deiminase